MINCQKNPKPLCCTLLSYVIHCTLFSWDCLLNFILWPARHQLVERTVSGPPTAPLHPRPKRQTEGVVLPAQPGLEQGDGGEGTHLETNHSAFWLSVPPSRLLSLLCCTTEKTGWNTHAPSVLAFAWARLCAKRVSCCMGARMKILVVLHAVGNRICFVLWIHFCQQAPQPCVKVIVVWNCPIFFINIDFFARVSCFRALY